MPQAEGDSVPLPLQQTSMRHSGRIPLDQDCSGLAAPPAASTVTCLRRLRRRRGAGAPLRGASAQPYPSRFATSARVASSQKAAASAVWFSWAKTSSCQPNASLRSRNSRVIVA